MAIQINPRRINGAPSGKAGDRRARPSVGGAAFIIPARADVNYIPAPESLRTLIMSAVAALREGVYWDRGTMLNLLV